MSIFFATPNGLVPSSGRSAWINASIYDPSQGLSGVRGGILISDGRIEAIGAEVHSENLGSDVEVRDLGGAVLIPGLIDMRCHISEPGGESRETIASASRAAAAGGITSVVMMPDTDPAMDDVALIDLALRTSRETAITRILPSAATTRNFGGREMTEYGLMQAAGAVMLSQAGTTIMDAGVVRRSMTYAADFDMLYGHVSHDPHLAGGGVMNESVLSTRLGLPGMPREAELLPLERDLRLARLSKVRYHAEKISTEMSESAVARAKDEGLAVSAGVTINHLLLTEDDIGEYRTFFKLAPPLRSDEDRIALLSAVKSGTIDVICSAHNPQGVDRKRLPFEEATDGAIGLETLLAAGLELVHSDQLSLDDLVRAMANRPAKLLKLESGRLAPGANADFAVVDPDLKWTVNVGQLQSKSKNTCFEDREFRGRVIETVVGGRTVFSLHGNASAA
ncbi:MAG: dihydroorotase [Pseudomonadota bacterium]